MIAGVWRNLSGLLGFIVWISMTLDYGNGVEALVEDVWRVLGILREWRLVCS